MVLEQFANVQEEDVDEVEATNMPKSSAMVADHSSSEQATIQVHAPKAHGRSQVLRSAQVVEGGLEATN